MTHHNDWYVIANASRARILERGHDAEPWVSIACLTHPQSRQKAARLADDRPGHVEGIGHGLGSTSYLPRTEPRHHEHEEFARAIAETVDAAVASGRCSGLILVASNPFLGVLKTQLGGQSNKILRKTVAHDYTNLSHTDLQARLSQAHI
jgi:protein required for attachment to host cells